MINKKKDWALSDFTAFAHMVKSGPLNDTEYELIECILELTSRLEKNYNKEFQSLNTKLAFEEGCG